MSRVAYKVEPARVGQRTDYDKLTLEVETNGALNPREAVAEAADLLIQQLSIFADEERLLGEDEPIELSGLRRRDGDGKAITWTTCSSRSSSSACVRTTASSARASRP